MLDAGGLLMGGSLAEAVAGWATLPVGDVPCIDPFR
jgi:hypothetical protein